MKLQAAASREFFSVERTCINLSPHDFPINFPLLAKYQFLTEIEKYLFTERVQDDEIAEEIFVNYVEDAMDQKVSSFIEYSTILCSWEAKGWKFERIKKASPRLAWKDIRQ